MKGLYGRTIGIPSLVRSRAVLGNITGEMRLELLEAADRVEVALQEARSVLALAGVAGHPVSAGLAEYDRLSAALDRLVGSLDGLAVAQRDIWLAEARQLEADARRLYAGLTASFGGQTKQKLWSVGLWAGGAAVLVAGAVLYLRRKKR